MIVTGQISVPSIHNVRAHPLLLSIVTRLRAHPVITSSCTRFTIMLLLLPMAAPIVFAQDQTTTVTTGAEALRVFLDCGPCNFDYLRREITFVNYVRDRPDAQVHVLVTREGTGGGGTAITLDFYGLEELTGVDDQLIYYTTQNDTDDDERRQFAQTLRLGLVRYAAQTPLGQNLQVSERGGALQAPQPTNAQPQDDLWNFWVFRTRFNVRLESEESEDTKSFRNQNLTARVAPAIEYNFFPYAESTRRQLTVNYAVGFNSFDYAEVTIFDETDERRIDHSVRTSLEVNEPWGDTDVTLEWSQFLDEPSQHRLVFLGDLEIRLSRGFFLSINGNSSLIRDQIFLPRRDATDEEILVRQRQLATDYEWRLRIGITYSFGSIFNNVVNSRFAGSNGEFTRAF